MVLMAGLKRCGCMEPGYDGSTWPSLIPIVDLKRWGCMYQGQRKWSSRSSHDYHCIHVVVFVLLIGALINGLICMAIFVMRARKHSKDK